MHVSSALEGREGFWVCCGGMGREGGGVFVAMTRVRTSDGRGGSAEETAGPTSASGAQSPAAEACAAELLSAHPSVAEAPTALWPGPIRLSAVSIWSMTRTKQMRTTSAFGLERPLACSDFPGICTLQLEPR